MKPMLAASVLLGTFVLSVPAFADVITLVNPGFEEPGTGKIDTGFDVANNDVPGWSNAGSVYADSGVENGGQGGSAWRGFLRNIDDGVMQVTNHTAAAGDRLTLSWWGSNTWQARELTGGLFYFDAANQRQMLGTTAATFTGDTAPYSEWTVNVEILPNSPAVGQKIGVYFDNTTPGNANWVGIDNVSLNVTPVPEPNTVAVIGLLALPLLRRRR